jgi:uroporphyrinogen-III synthase
MDVIITRPAVDAAPFAEMISKAGGNPIVSPVMEIRFLDAPVNLAETDALAFTSANGVRAFVRNSADRNPTVFAVGEATAAAARSEGFKLVEVAGGDVDNLADLIAEQKPSARILHVAGGDRAGELSDLLAARDTTAQRLVLYHAVPLPLCSDYAVKALRRGGAVVTFFSPRTVRLFIEQTQRSGIEPQLAAASALCLSPQVSAAVAECDWKEIILADGRTAVHMAAAVGELVRSRKSRGVEPR